MEIQAADKQAQAHSQADTTKSTKSPHTNEGGDLGLPLPPSSTKASGSDGDRNEQNSGLLEVAGGKPTIGGSSTGASRLAEAGRHNRKPLKDYRLMVLIDTVNDELPKGPSPSDTVKEESSHQGKDTNRDGKNTASRYKSDEDDSSDENYIRKGLDRIFWGTLFPEENDPIEERINEAPRRAVQQMEYTKFMDDRMRRLEERLRLLENRGVEPKLPTLKENQVQLADFKMGIKRMTFEEYLPLDPNPGIMSSSKKIKHKRRHEFPGQLPYHLIDVVFSAADLSERLSKDSDTMLTGGPSHPTKSRFGISSPTPTTLDGQFVQPERIRINSTVLLEALQRITSLEFSKSWIGDEEELRDQVILRPFKLFVAFEQEIRDEIDRLEKIHMRSSNDSIPEAPEMVSCEGQDTSVPHNEPEDLSRKHRDDLTNDKSRNSKAHVTATESPLESKQCLEAMLSLRELLDKDLKPTFDLRKQIKEGVIRSIAFQDLWHLFQIGDEIVSNNSDGQYQIYRVLNVSGGKPFLCSRRDAKMETLESSSNPSDLPKFEILSFYYGYDGKELGACQQLHTIKSYDGSKAIASLPCFPIIYSRNSQELKSREFGIGRGRRFIELIRETDVVHKRYDGRTLAMDELREEVRSGPPHHMSCFLPLLSSGRLRSHNRCQYGYVKEQLEHGFWCRSRTGTR